MKAKSIERRKFKLPGSRLFSKLFKPLDLVFKFLGDIYELVKKRVDRSLRMQLIFFFGISFLSAALVFAMSDAFFGNLNRDVYIDYTVGRESIDYKARSIAEMIQSRDYLLQMEKGPIEQITPPLGFSQEQSQTQSQSLNQSQSQSLNQSQSQSQSQSQNTTTTIEKPLVSQENNNSVPDIDGDQSINQRNNQAVDIDKAEASLKNLQDYLNKEAQNNNFRVLLVDFNGKVLFKSKNATEVQVDLHNIIANAMNTRISSSSQPGQEFFSFYPLKEKEIKGYIVVSGFPEARIAYTKPQDSSIALINAFAAFIMVFFVLTRPKMKYIEHLAGGLFEISKGNLDFRVQQKSKDELGSLASNINHMAEELNRKIEEERKAERTKNELITNVSHDLRTPLTSIMGYLRLIKDQKYESTEQLDNYVSIIFGKSEKLKTLIDDLFEYTKLTNEDIRLYQQRISFNELLEQLIDELVPIAEENSLTFLKIIPTEKLMINIDVDKMVRVFENILMNAIKYSLKPGVINVSVRKENDRVITCIQNKGEPFSQADINNVFERFYRVEKSRSSSSGGSGLGLAIAKSIVELHGGEIWAESKEDDIRFYVSLKDA